MIGETVAQRYRVLRLIGKGGMGEVFEARDAERRERVALKMLHPGIREDRHIKRFIREAKVAAALESHHTVRLLDAGFDEASGRHYLATELFVGEDLSKLLQRGPLAPGLVMRIAAQCCQGLEHAHRAGVVHRDIKPQNLYLARDGEVRIVKIIDFGVAKLQPQASGIASGRLTDTGSLLGSPRYISPEQAAGERSVDARTDIWSLGVVMYEALSGRCPHEDESVGELLLQICSAPAPPLLEVAPDTPAPLAEIIMRAIERKRDDRYSTADELGQALNALIDGNATIPEAMVSSETTSAEQAVAQRGLDPKQIAVAVGVTLAVAIYLALR